jgi:hypothetical protein
MKDNTFYENLFAAKREIGKISKDSTNPFFKSKYFDINSLLEHTEPILNKHGLFVVQPIEDDVVTTKIIDEKGFGIASGMRLPQLSDPQKMGSAITYYRRYTLQSLLALQAEDDDGNGASKAVKKPKRLTAEQLSQTLASNNLNAVKAVYDTFVLDDREKELIFERITELAAL